MEFHLWFEKFFEQSVSNIESYRFELKFRIPNAHE